MSKTVINETTPATDESLLTKIINSRQAEIDDETKEKARKIGKIALIVTAASALAVVGFAIVKSMSSDEDSETETSDETTED
jgi:hypothetical protein